MFTKLASVVIATLGLLATAGDSPIAKPTCCAKHAYCCKIDRPCCDKGNNVDTTIATLAADVNVVAKPTCCIKHAYCCKSHRSCCPKTSAVNTSDVEAVELVAVASNEIA